MEKVRFFFQIHACFRLPRFVSDVNSLSQERQISAFRGCALEPGRKAHAHRHYGTES